MSATWIAKRVASLTVGAVTGFVTPKELERIGAMFSGDIPKKPKPAEKEGT